MTTTYPGVVKAWHLQLEEPVAVKFLLPELAASEDKDFVVIEGAEHGQTPCVPCEATPGQYSNSVKNFYDYAAGWIDRRF